MTFAGRFWPLKVAFFRLIPLLFFSSSVLSPATAWAAEPEVVVWLLPAEPGMQPSSIDEMPTDDAVDRLNAELVPPGVTLENTADPRLRAQLGAWNPEFAVPNLAWLRGQTVTLKALGRFAALKHLRVRVRFWTWTGIFPALRAGLGGGGLPDVSQVGSGWVSYFGASGTLASFGDAATPALRRNYGGVSGVSLRYTSDVRLLYYWRRLPRAGSPEVLIDRTSWGAFVDSLTRQGGPPFALPTGATLNVIHDLLPLLGPEPNSLFHSGLTGPFIRLTPISMEVPVLLATRSLVYDKRGLPRRLIAFPEVAHEEALRSFMAGGYCGIIEPVGFLRRWFDEFSKTAAKQPGMGSFWEHAGAVAPPTTFKGGSDLVVFKGSSHSGEGRDLAVFLASDPDYTKMLAENGNLPVALGRKGIESLMEPISDSLEAQGAIARISDQIELSERIGSEEPALALWPVEIESRETIESFQNVWRRMADGNPAAVKVTLDDLEETLNGRLNQATRVKQIVYRVWPLISFVLLAMVGFITWDAAMRVKQSEAARLLSEDARRRSDDARVLSEKARKIQGFTAAALGVVDKIHRRRGPYIVPGSDATTAAEKSALVAVGLDGWLRGLDCQNWEPAILCEVIWRSILLALDFQKVPGIFEKYSAAEGGCGSIPKYLVNEGLLRGSREPNAGRADVFFDVVCDPRFLVDLPFMMEQCLTCLLQNALAASETPSRGPDDFKTFLPIDIHVGDEFVEIRNKCSKPFSPSLAGVLSDDLTVNEFVECTRALLSGPVADRPGLGTIVSTLIAKECYGGLLVMAGASETAVRVSLVPNPGSRWRLNSPGKERGRT
jgi:hypothetical protein